MPKKPLFSWPLVPKESGPDPYDVDPEYAAELDRCIDYMMQAFDTYWKEQGTISLNIAHRAIRIAADMLCDDLAEQMNEIDQEIATEEADA
jgi:hypothetical protein